MLTLAPIITNAVKGEIAHREAKGSVQVSTESINVEKPDIYLIILILIPGQMSWKSITISIIHRSSTNCGIWDSTLHPAVRAIIQPPGFPFLHCL